MQHAGCKGMICLRFEASTLPGRDDVKGIGVNSGGDPGKFVIAFFHNSEPEAAIVFAINRLADNLAISLTSVNGVAAAASYRMR
jgi:hypothetical protein